VTRAVILSGGILHDFAATSAAVRDVLADAGFEVTISADVEGALERLGDVDLLVVNCMKWCTHEEFHPERRPEWHLRLRDSARDGLLGFLGRGGGVLALHTASISFDDLPAWRHALGARWVWGRTTHPPRGATHVVVRTDAHPVVAGLTSFDIHDEVYSWLDVAPDVVPLAWSRHSDVDHPLVWAREVGDGARIVYDALGHGPESYASDTHRRLVRNAAKWLTESRREEGRSCGPNAGRKVVGQPPT
jgi:type 1 glutamine amidotransferase